MYCYLLFLFVFVINCSTSHEDSFVWTFHCANEVTQRITTGSVIPLEASALTSEKGLIKHLSNKAYTPANDKNE